MIAKDALVYAQQGKRKTLQRKDLGKCYKEMIMQFANAYRVSGLLKWVNGVIVAQLMENQVVTNMFTCILTNY